MGDANKGAASDTETTSIPSDVGPGDKGDEIWRESVVPGTDDEIRGEGVDHDTGRPGGDRRDKQGQVDGRLTADRRPVLSQPPRETSADTAFVAADPATEAATRTRGDKG
ncbi:hypothetical protein [Methyloraptor flagellatus]|uniref:Uncharacterized protein n=1 Tax=Methyloraptor flagellatus TaxID=3162530 RepID=A0AAU7X6I2_9HYPH